MDRNDKLRGNESQYLKWFSVIISAYIAPLVITVIILLLLVLTGDLPLKQSQNFNETTRANLLCRNDQCNYVSEKIKNSLNLDINPCEDFYSYACSGTANTKVLYRDTVEAFYERDIEERLLEIIQEEPVNASKIEKVVHQFYDKCMESERLQMFFLDEYIKILNVLHVPIFERELWNKNNTWSWQNDLRMIYKYGYDAAYLFAVKVEPIDKRKFGLIIGEPRTAKYLVDDTQFIELFNYFLKFKIKNEESRNKDLNDVLGFKTSLNNITVKGKEMHVTLEKLQKKFGFIRWTSFLNSLLPKGLQFSQTQAIHSNQFEYLENLNELLKRTPKHVIANYFACRIIEDSLVHLPHNIYWSALGMIGSKRQQIKQKCIDTVKFGPTRNLLFYMYSKKFSTEARWKSAKQISSKIKSYAEKLIDYADWIDKDKKIKVKKALSEVSINVGSMSQHMDRKVLTRLYGEVDSNGNYLDYYLKMQRAYFQFLLRCIFHPVPASEMAFLEKASSFDRNPYFLRQAHSQSLMVPIGTLDGPSGIYYEKTPNYLNFAQLGFTVSQQLLHAINDSDLNSIFSQKKECLINQYSDYYEKSVNLHIDGNQSFFENFADVVGLKIAYKSYKMWADRHEEEVMLPYLGEYSRNQLFWIWFAQFFCQKSSNETIENIIRNTSYSTPRHRVIGSIQSNKDFAEDFNCQPNDFMNSNKRCGF